MFIRKLKNRSGSLSVQVIQKTNGKYKVLKTLGSATTQHEIENLVNLARQEIDSLSAQPKLFVSQIDAAIEQAFVRSVAILVLDMCGFSRITQSHGIIHFLAMIHQMEQAARPAIEGNGGEVIK